MGRLAVVLVGAFFLAGCAFAGSDAERGSARPPPTHGNPFELWPLRLRFVAHSDPDVAVVDSCTILRSRIQRGEQPTRRRE